jgi:hypothetical protein
MDDGRFLEYIPWLVRVGGGLPHPFTLFTITYKVAMYAPADSGDTIHLFYLYPHMYSVGSTQLQNTENNKEDRAVCCRWLHLRFSVG